MILEKLGGGGSFNNAGVKIEGSTMEEVIDNLKNEIHEYLGKKDKDKE